MKLSREILSIALLSFAPFLSFAHIWSTFFLSHKNICIKNIFFHSRCDKTDDNELNINLVPQRSSGSDERYVFPFLFFPFSSSFSTLAKATSNFIFVIKRTRAPESEIDINSMERI